MKLLYKIGTLGVNVGTVERECYVNGLRMYFFTNGCWCYEWHVIGEANG
jgi:hypothetical protein